MRNWFGLKKTRVQSLFALLILALGGLPAAAQLGGPPLIAVQPLGLSVQEGGSATVLVVAVSLTKAYYQWYLNETNKISGATAATLTIKNVSSSDTGKYTVQIKNSSGTTTSQPATLLVLGVVNVVTNVLQITTGALTKTGFQLQLNNITNSTCVIYSSTNLVTWTPISTNTPSSGKVTYTDPSATNRPFCYYKALSQ
jgi:hypothetical protein